MAFVGQERIEYSNRRTCVSDRINRVIDVLSGVVDPDRGKDIIRLGLIRDLRDSGDQISFTIFLKDPARPFASRVELLCTDAIRREFGQELQIRLEMDNEMIGLGDEMKVDSDGSGKTPGDDVLNIVAVASGKGGVGKSTVAVNLAISLASQGYEVGIMDADIYGPSIPTMFGLENAKPEVNRNRQIVPIEKYGVKVLSMGFLVDTDKAVIWRGPMVSSAIRQFLGETAWGDLDFLILDLPPGTGDIQLTIVQTVPLSGALIVSTPQRVALADARKGVAMFEQVSVPVLGIIENMAYFTPPDLPDRKYYLFGEGGATKLAEELEIPLLSELPIEESLRQSCDEGRPISASGNESFDTLAESVAREVFIRNATGPATAKIDILNQRG